MHIVVALGGNALLKRGEPMTADAQRANVRQAATSLAVLVGAGHQIVVTHGNGPQVGLLALQSAAGPKDGAYPLDILGAESEGMIGYVIEQELGNLLPDGTLLATLLTQVRVDAKDPAFRHPTKPIGPVYDEAAARRIEADRGWTFALDGNKWRRVVASPDPLEILEMKVISILVEAGVVVICAGGGGISAAMAVSSGSRRSSTRTAPALSLPARSAPICFCCSPTSMLSISTSVSRTRAASHALVSPLLRQANSLPARWARRWKRRRCSPRQPGVRPRSVVSTTLLQSCEVMLERELKPARRKSKSVDRVRSRI